MKMRSFGSLSLSCRRCACPLMLERLQCMSGELPSEAQALEKRSLLSFSLAPPLLEPLCGCFGLPGVCDSDGRYAEQGRSLTPLARARTRSESERRERRVQVRATDLLEPLLSRLLDTETANAVARSEWCGGAGI